MDKMTDDKLASTLSFSPRSESMNSQPSCNLRDGWKHHRFLHVTDTEAEANMPMVHLRPDPKTLKLALQVNGQPGVRLRSVASDFQFLV